MTVFWDIALPSVVEVDRRFRDVYYRPNHQGDHRPNDGGSTRSRENQKPRVYHRVNKSKQGDDALIEAERTSETSVYFNETKWRYIPEGYHLQTAVRT